MWNYRKRVIKDVERWQQQGWIGSDNARSIVADLAARRSPFGTAGALAILGAVLIGFAAMSFVAANWQDMSRLLRLGLLFATLWASYGAAGYLATRKMGMFANAATLIGVGIFGASIMLIAQMFHIEGNPPDAVLMWGAGALLAGAALSSTAALGAAMLLAILWGGWQQILTDGVFWGFLAGWAAISAVYVWQKWRPGLHLSAIALTVFIISLGYTLWSGGAHGVVATIGLVCVGAAFTARQFLPTRFDDEALVSVGYGMVVAFAGLFAVQFFDRIDVQQLIVVAVFTLGLLLAAIYWGVINEQRVILWLGYAGLSLC